MKPITRVRRAITLICILAASNFTALAPTSAAEKECAEKACIEVYTQDGKIVIEGRKGTGPSSSRTVTPTQRPTPRPTVKATAAPKKVAPPKPAKKAVVASKAPPVKKVPVKKPVVKKPVVKKPVVKGTDSEATSLSDRLVEILPTAGIAYSPSFQPLIKVPVFFWSDIPEVIVKKIAIVGEIVEVKLRPTFLWHYGDGAVYATRNVGGTYPDGQIQHSYSTPGHYLIQLITSWDGEFTVQGVKSRIPGQIKTVSALPITVVAAPTRFTPPSLHLR
jgi:hypothetical protein